MDRAIGVGHALPNVRSKMRFYRGDSLLERFEGEVAIERNMIDILEGSVNLLEAEFSRTAWAQCSTTTCCRMLEAAKPFFGSSSSQFAILKKRSSAIVSHTIKGK
jgi:hypothetical protein